MINHNESFAKKESQWYSYRFSYSNVENVSYTVHLAVTQVASDRESTEKTPLKLTKLISND